MKRDRPIAGAFNALALLGLVFGVPIAVAWGIDRPLPWMGGADDSIWSALSGSGALSLLLSMLVVMVGTAWAVFVLSILKELVSVMGGVSSSDVPGFQVPQSVARHMVGSAARLMMAAPSGGASQPSSRSSAKGRRSIPVTRLGQSRDHLECGQSDSLATSHISYRVLPGDSLWSIASTELGQGSRWDEIAGLNRSLLGERPGFLTPGLHLLLPPVTTTRRANDVGEREQQLAREPRYHIHSVREGETLSSIAGDWLGATHRYTEILEASRDIVQPGGRRLLDSRVLTVGWKVAIPRTDAAPDSSADDAVLGAEAEPAATAPMPTAPMPTASMAPSITEPSRRPAAELRPASYAHFRRDEREPHLGS